MLRTASILLCGLLAACGQQQPPTPAPAPQAPAPQAAAPSAAAPAPVAIARKPAPPGAVAYIISPTDGATVTNPVRVVFGLKGIGIAPAGTDRADAGHHHLLVDVDLPPLDLPIPKDDQHQHFGAGQTETALTLAPGKHTLRLLLGDHVHVPFDPPIVSDPVTIEVQ